MSDDKGRTKWIDNVLVVWVEHEAISHLAYKKLATGRNGLNLEADDSLELEVLFGYLFHFSFKILFNLVEIVSNLSDCNGSLNVKGCLTTVDVSLLNLHCITVNILAL